MGDGPPFSPRSQGCANHNPHVRTVTYAWDSALVAGTNLILVDVSDTTNYPHDIAAGSVWVHGWSLDIAGTGGFVGGMDMGVITSGSAGTSVIDVFAHVHTYGPSEAGMYHMGDPRGIKIYDSGDVPLMAGGSAHIITTAFGTATANTSTYGTSTPYLGDIVIIIELESGTISHAFGMVQYYTTS